MSDATPRRVRHLLLPDDLDRVRKMRDKQVEYGGTWQAWQRVLRALEDYVELDAMRHTEAPHA